MDSPARHSTRRTIRALPVEVVNRIAAGEVIERPAAVVKELGENALDAGATRLRIEVEEGGKRLIRIVDDGHGIPHDQLALAVAPHATSKIDEASDLVHIGSFGFRGEALASIASVASLTIRSREPGTPTGGEVLIERGAIAPGYPRPCGCPEGTDITVRELFRNTPVREKFMRSATGEYSHTVRAVQRLALAHTDVGFTLHHDGRLAFDLPPGTPLKQRILEFFERGLEEDALLEVAGYDGDVRVEGYVAAPAHSRRDSMQVLVFVNRRYLRNRELIAAVREAYREFLPPGRYPTAILMLAMPVTDYDVNVHPQKIDVRFKQQRRLFGLIRGTIQRRLAASNFLPRVPMGTFSPVTPRDVPADEAYAGPLPPRDADLLALWGAPPTPAGTPPPPAAGSPDAANASADVTAVPPEGDLPETGFVTSARVPLAGDARAAWQIHNAYLAVEYADRLEIVDQHALHERILFDRLSHAFTDGIERQRLLHPEPLEGLDMAHTAFLADPRAREAFAVVGFEIDELGPRTWAVYAIPVLLAKRMRRAGIHAVMQAAVADLAESDEPPAFKDLARHVIATLACKAAIKAGDPLEPAEVEALLAEAARQPNRPYACPHGRPTTLVLPFSRLDHHFGR